MSTKKTGLIQELGPHGEVMKETEYIDGKKHGIQTCYDPDGNPVKITTYENNVRVYEETFYKGQLVSKTPYFNGKKEGICEQFYNGHKITETQYSNGKKDGIEITYHSNGKIAKKSIYHNGKKDWNNREEYHPNGNPSMIVKKDEYGIITTTSYQTDSGVPSTQSLTREDGSFIKTNLFYRHGIIGQVEQNRESLYFDPAGNQITSDEFYSTHLSDHVGWARIDTEITEDEFIKRRNDVVRKRLAAYNDEMAHFGTAWTKPLKITPVNSSKPIAIASSEPEYLSLQNPEHTALESIKPCRDNPPKVGFSVEC